MSLKKPTVQVTPTCNTCKWFSGRNMTNHGNCMPDLPPMVKRSDNPAHYTTNRNYTCALHQVKPGIN